MMRRRAVRRNICVLITISCPVLFNLLIIQLAFKSNTNEILAPKVNNNATGKPNCNFRMSDRVTIDAVKNCNDESNRSLVIDVVSIGSITRSEYMTAQMETWAAHPSIRSFWGFSESDDAKNCTSGLNATQYISKCATPHEEDNPFTRFARKRHYNETQIMTMPNTAGWLCAQRRPGQALVKRGSEYRLDAKVRGLQSALPDYLLLIDDDTYFNMDLFLDHAKNEDPSIPVVYADCLIYIKIYAMSTVPSGGYGLIFSRGSLERLIHPIYCNESHDEKDISDEIKHFKSKVCTRIGQNLLGEKEFFSPGMSISDIMYELSANKQDFCMHSDLLTGFIVNYYFISNKNEEFPYRLHEYTGNVLCTAKDTAECDDSLHICHHQTPSSMKQLSGFSQLE